MSDKEKLIQEHATTIAIPEDNTAQRWSAVMLRGPSGSGKSDLALRLIDQGAVLVADDRSCLEYKEKTIWVSPPKPLAGKLEVRGLGIMQVSYKELAELKLVVDLKPLNEIERIPEQKTVTYLGHDVPYVQICAFETSAALKIRYALNADWLEI
ncbi:HPr kinase/phosphorylase [Curvivirga sp.]|uniref:HPr kinase/phosphorylase n=1 Tax=Curvivirga sp. TaxID=2856848 RepID=UPI003B5C5683